MNDGDHVSFVPFESQVISELFVALTLVDTGNRQGIRNKINTCRTARGGTQLYHALNVSLDEIAKGGGKGQDFGSWIICLTDGESDGAPEEVLPNLRNRPDAHLIIIGVALPARLIPTMQTLCGCLGAEGKGQFIAAMSETASLNDAFSTAAQLLPVSEVVTLAEISADECRALLHKHMPKRIVDLRTGGMLLQRYWVEYLHRRVLVFDESPDFNYNEKYDALGSTLMETMLEEVERALHDNHRKCWKVEAHQQLVYDFSGGRRAYLRSYLHRSGQNGGTNETKV